MATFVTVNTTTGSYPINVWVCNDCSSGATNVCQYIDTIDNVGELPYTFQLPSIYENSLGYSIKFEDSNNCEICGEYSIFKQFEDGDTFIFMDGTPYEFQ